MRYFIQEITTQYSTNMIKNNKQIQYIHWNAT